MERAETTQNQSFPHETTQSQSFPPWNQSFLLETSWNQSFFLWKQQKQVPSHRNQSPSSCGHAVRAFVKVIPILYNSREFFRPVHSTYFTNRRWCDFQIAVASACLLDIRTSSICTSSWICLGGGGGTKL